ncbi:MAG: MFS transporter [Candidatus Marinimicrobia bacterium]|nr:MFS transporter [Candidatus Neomarinimicrobiota bacterium]MBL7067059.1 MFS transporter [Candidatus Neomarinimicrobiota bacterium]
MEKRSSFPPVFWVANGIEVLERFAYYGIYMGFGIYMEYLGYTKGQLGIVQSLFLLFSYTVPIISGTFADRFGFKKVLIISYLAYLPSILLLILTKSFSGIALTMLSIALAAGIFKPLISGTVRVVTDKTNKTLGFGIFYAMVNVGASFGPVIAGQLRAISWNYAFLAAAISICFMLLITIFFYKEPKREIEGITLKQKFKDMAIVFSDVKFSLFLIILGVFFWLPFWAFFNLVPVYIDQNIDTAQLYLNLKSLFGAGFTSIFSHTDEKGVWRILGETVAHTGYIIMICQIFVSRWAEKFKAMPTFLFGLFMSAIGFIVLGVAKIGAPALIFLGIFLFAIGEMISSPRIQEYITWIAPKEKAGLYMGTNFLATGLGGALSGVTYTSLYGYFQNIAHPEYIWYSLAAHFVIGIIVIFIFTKMLGEFKELDE